MDTLTHALSGAPTQKPGVSGFFGELAAAYPRSDAIEWRRRYRYGSDHHAADEAHRAWHSDAIADFRRFARFPLYTGGGNADDPCYHFADLRFELPGVGKLFNFGVCPN